jgi:hypothetical protein
MLSFDIIGDARWFNKQRDPLLSGLTPAAMSMVGDTIPLSKQGRWIGDHSAST